MKATSRVVLNLLSAQRDAQAARKEYEKAQYEHGIAVEQLISSGMKLATLDFKVNMLQELARRGSETNE